MMFLSGQWKGFWEQAGWGRQWMEPLIFHFEAGQVQGEGKDILGSFTFTGVFDETGKVVLVKQYIGQHKVFYSGQVAGEGEIVGQWNVPPFWFGPFAFIPVRDNTAQLPIQTLTFTPKQK